MKTVIFDVDGVLASFDAGFKSLLAQLGKDPESNKASWGTSPDEGDREAWDRIKADPHFWTALPPIVSAEERDGIVDLERGGHRLYFVTNRPVGNNSKRQTEDWLLAFGIQRPTVIISGLKGEIAKALEADYAIDDKAGNALFIAYYSPRTKSYLLDARRTATRPGNQFDHDVIGRKVTRVGSVAEFLEHVRR